MALLKNRPKKSVALIAAAGMTIAGTGVAFAYWTAQGTGAGQAQTGTAVALVITSDAAAGPVLTPGGTPGQTVAFHVSNPSTGDQRLSDVFVAVANADGSPWTRGACSSLDYAVSITGDPSPAVIAPGDDVDGQASIQMIETDANQDDCQGVTVPLYFYTNQPV